MNISFSDKINSIQKSPNWNASHAQNSISVGIGNFGESTAIFENGQIKSLSKNIKETTKARGKMLSFEHSFNSVESGNKKSSFVIMFIYVLVLLISFYIIFLFIMDLYALK